MTGRRRRRLAAGLGLWLAGVAGCRGDRPPAGTAAGYEVYARLAEAADPGARVVTLERVDVAAFDPPAGADLVWPVTLEPGSRLRFGFAPAGAGAEEATVTVTARDARGRSRELYRREEAWRPGTGRLRWAAVPLDGESGERELVFAASGPGGGEVRLSWLAPALLRPARASRPNVVLVCIDTLRADRLLGEAGRATMPNLARRVAGGAVFPEAYANSSWSLPSMATLLTGLYPGQHNAGRRALVGESEAAIDYNARVADGGIELTIGHRVYRYQMLHPSVPTLQGLLGEAGYLTAAVHNNGYVSYPTRVLAGFDFVEHYERRDAAVGTARALEWIDGADGARFLLFLHYIDPHQWPREVPEELRDAELNDLDEADRRAVLATYDRLVRYTDRHLEELFRGLESRGLAGDTLVVVVADHGERFFEKGVVGSHGGSFLETVTRVPLAFWGPSVPAGVIDTRAQLVDVVPTVLDLVGERSGPRFEGRSLVAAMAGEPRGLADRDVITEFVLWGPEHAALLDGRWKYVLYPDAERGELYDVAEDPGELRDLAAERPEVAAGLHERLVSYLGDSARRFAALEYGETAADEKMLESLRALGYLD